MLQIAFKTNTEPCTRQDIILGTRAKNSFMSLKFQIVPFRSITHIVLKFTVHPLYAIGADEYGLSLSIH